MLSARPVNRLARIAVMCLGLGAGCTADPANEEVGVASATLLSSANCPAGYNIIEGDSSANTLNGTAGSDCILGHGGNDTINGMGGDDFLVGGAGADIIYGNLGNDVIYGEAGNDDLNGDQGNDTIYGGAGSDYVGGNAGDDRLFGEAGIDYIYGDEDNDILVGGDKKDHLYGGTGNDVLAGGAGVDQLYGQDGDDAISDSGNNTVDGGSGTDRCTGTSCELAAPVANGCTQASQCDVSQTCVADVGVCLPCGTVGGVGCNLPDNCPSDPNKTEPGICGCDVADTDSDGDGTANCNDACASDPDKVEPGICGCGMSDADSDSDGSADCIDGCPADPAKVATGLCGCGISDVDADTDGTPDCYDGCPADATKIEPGTCGCGVSDVDSNGDGVCDDQVGLTIELVGDGGGRVVSTDGTIDCSETCTVGVDPWAQVTLTATADAASQLVSLKGDGCAGTGPCTFAIGEQASIKAVFVTGNIAFVTSTTSTGNLGGLAGADARCATRAAEAGLPGNYVAFLSTSTVHAINRLAGSRGWWRTDGLPFLDSPQDIPAIKSFYPPSRNEFGDDAGFFVTGTGANGNLSLTDHCQNWTSAATSQVGRLGSPTSAKWHSSTRPNCSIQTSLLCMQLGRVSPIVVPPTPSRLIFLTADPIGLVGVNGVSGLDAICQTQAEQHGFADAGVPSFKALVRDGQTPPAQRFDLNGLPWSRPDNVMTMASAGALATQTLIAPPSVASDGTYLPMEPQDTVFWTGASHWNSNLNPNCSDWTTSSTQINATVGSANLLTALSNYRTFNCGQLAHLLCLEE